MGKLIQTSKVKISKEPGKNKIKRAEIEGFPGALRMGIHGGIAQYFKLSPEEPMASTLDYIVAAVGGCMTGTVAGALEARGVSANPDKLQVEAEGRIVKTGNTSRRMEFEARKVIAAHPEINESAADVLDPPVVVCRATGTCVTPKSKKRR